MKPSTLNLSNPQYDRFKNERTGHHKTATSAKSNLYCLHEKKMLNSTGALLCDYSFYYPRSNLHLKQEVFGFNSSNITPLSPVISCYVLLLPHYQASTVPPVPLVAHEITKYV